MITDELKQMKQEAKLTNQQISDRSGVPLATVNRILSGQTDNPSYETVIALIKAMKPEEKNNRDICDIYEKIIANKNKWIVRLFCFALAMVAILAFLVIYDIFNRSIGYIH